MALREKGRYYELPLAGCKLCKIAYNGVLCLYFDESDETYLTLIGKFELVEHGQTSILLPTSREALLVCYDLLNAGITIKSAQADKEGRLFLVFDNKLELTVAGPSDYWDFTHRSSQNARNNVSVSGGLGYLDF
ncbi:MAG: hypothetical protein ACRYFZ_04445 [Janthinobacterium lividum]